MIGRKGKFWGGSEKQSALELRWRQVADCSRGGFQPPETHDRRRWTAVYVGSLAAKTVKLLISNWYNLVWTSVFGGSVWGLMTFDLDLQPLTLTFDLVSQNGWQYAEFMLLSNTSLIVIVSCSVQLFGDGECWLQHVSRFKRHESKVQL